MMGMLVLPSSADRLASSGLPRLAAPATRQRPLQASASCSASHHGPYQLHSSHSARLRRDEAGVSGYSTAVGSGFRKIGSGVMAPGSPPALRHPSTTCSNSSSLSSSGVAGAVGCSIVCCSGCFWCFFDMCFPFCVLSLVVWLSAVPVFP